ncbi:hypothetical protein JCM10831_11310 [Hydrogenophilus hirschii]
MKETAYEKKVEIDGATLYLGDCLDVLRTLPDNSVDLVFTSPPYADQRKNTYGGIHPDKYVEWFLPISEQLLRVLKPDGTFCLNLNPWSPKSKPFL